MRRCTGDQRPGNRSRPRGISSSRTGASQDAAIRPASPKSRTRSTSPSRPPASTPACAIRCRQFEDLLLRWRFGSFQQINQVFPVMAVLLIQREATQSADCAMARPFAVQPFELAPILVSLSVFATRFRFKNCILKSRQNQARSRSRLQGFTATQAPYQADHGQTNTKINSN